MPDLERYKAKRHADKTPEPFGAHAPKGKAPIFVVQRHSARRLHYDFRLERDGVLLSWALPRGVPLRGGERALAVHVEDHPLDYATLRGRDPGGRVRRRHGRHLGSRHLRAAARAARRHAHRDPAREARRGRVGARTHEARRQREELADRARDEDGCARRPGRLRADARAGGDAASPGARTGRSSSPGKARVRSRPSRAPRAACSTTRARRSMRAAATCSRRCRARCARASACSTA